MLSYARLDVNEDVNEEFVSKVWEKQVRRVCAPLLVMSENRVRLTDRSELPLSRWIVIYIRMVPFAELAGHLVSGNSWVATGLKIPCRSLSDAIHK